MERIAVDLLWLRPGKVGGTESYIRNLLDGFMQLEYDFAFALLVSKDNIDSFRKYEADNRFTLLRAEIESENIAKRIIWQNLCQNRFLKKNGIFRCFEPVYCKPWFNGSIEYTCVIHDLQAYHYPQYHPLHEIIYSRVCWRMDVWNAKHIIAISNWVKNDIIMKYKRNDIEVIYNPITIKTDEVADFDILKDRYGLEEKNFFYTVTQMIPHKNIKTLISVMEIIVNRGDCLPKKLVISGVNGSAENELKTLIFKKNLQDNIIFTGYISNAERNTLYKGCHSFLFPSVFEGFGMPPIEAMLFGTKVVTTKCTSIPEVTQEKALYVNDPYDAEEWIETIKCDWNSKKIDFSDYEIKSIAKKYMELLQEQTWKK